MEEDRDDDTGDSGHAPRRSSFLGELILDASVSLNWLVDEELDPTAARVSANIARYDIFVPPIWQLEMRNVLLMAERRGRITRARLEERLLDLAALPVNDDTDTDFDTTFALARAHRLSFYDATYLELAIRRQAPLATLDSALDRAANSEGLPALP